VLGAEAGGLSPEVANEILSFFRRCIGDLSQRIGGPDAEARAFQVIATLEGGMMLARAYQDTSAFDQAAAGLVWPCAGSTGRAIARSESPATPRPNLWET
jgi:TetR/AcrR family transcriptional repressor of nem operon